MPLLISLLCVCVLHSYIFLFPIPKNDFFYVSLPVKLLIMKTFIYYNHRVRCYQCLSNLGVRLSYSLHMLYMGSLSLFLSFFCYLPEPDRGRGQMIWRFSARIHSQSFGIHLLSHLYFIHVIYHMFLSHKAFNLFL